MAVEIGFVREQRSLWKAIGNGAMCRCPSCGKGKLFRSYLKLNDTCSECGEKLSSARADDFPPYIAIFIVGHVLIGWMLHAEMSGPVDPMLYVWTMIPAAICCRWSCCPRSRAPSSACSGPTTCTASIRRAAILRAATSDLLSGRPAVPLTTGRKSVGSGQISTGRLAG